MDPAAEHPGKNRGALQRVSSRPNPVRAAVRPANHAVVALQHCLSSFDFVKREEAAIADRRQASRSALEAFATGNFGIYDSVIADDFVDHDPQNPFAAAMRGPQLMRATATLYRTALPDLVLTIDAQYEDGDIVITRGTLAGTQTGELPGLPATGKRATIGGVQIDRFDGDKITESWRYWDSLGMLQQLGAVPRPRAWP